MAFSGLTSGERKRLQQGILTPKQAQLISARAEAQGGGGGFWSSTWGKVVRAVGVAALNFVPVVGSVASTAVGAYDKQRFADLQKKANEQYVAAAQEAATAARVTQVQPVLESSPYPWLPDFGSIGRGYTGTVANVGAAQPTTSPFAELQDAVSNVPAWQWLVLIGVVAFFIFGIFRGSRS